MITRIIGCILGICLIVGLPLSIIKHINYLYTGSRKELTELQRCERQLTFLILLTLVAIVTIGIMSVLVK